MWIEVNGYPLDIVKRPDDTTQDLRIEVLMDMFRDRGHEVAGPFEEKK